MIKAGGDIAVEKIREPNITLLKAENMPKTWKNAAMIFKKGDKIDFANYNSISLLSHLHKLSMKKTYLQNKLHTNKVIPQ